MEIFWYIIAAGAAGIGTGLAGLSAATVMVPILIVLCPTFGGETGAYQATAIALASDILGSAVTAWTYARNRHIDLRRGWIMLVCILSMCTVGSYVAWLAGNVVLGGFTLFLTFCIGIRFLVKPDTTREDSGKEGKLDARGIAISLFFGLTIGFGTGFVGTGGGMMMLVVFTVFLGMEVKTAVGTSTFIMTFTALIASVSHILIHPAIVLERWNVMLICIIIATATSLISARFANRVDNRTVGFVTGGVLTVLGAWMIILNYWDIIEGMPLLFNVILCFGHLIRFILPCLCVLLPVRFLTKVPDYVFRKLLHIVAISCVTLMLLAVSDWRAASLVSVIIAVVLYPVLALLEDRTWYSKLFVQKKPGEIKNSMAMLFLMFAMITAIAWGMLGRRYVAAAAILMWGIGDGMAALIGIPFGKHKVQIGRNGGKKSIEGSAAMFAASFLSGILIYLRYSPYSAGISILIAVLGAGMGALVEMLSPSEWDTVTVPISILALNVLFVLII